MVKTAEADVVSPAVAAEDPDGLLDEVLFLAQDFTAEDASLTVATVNNRILKSSNVFLGSISVCLPSFMVSTKPEQLLSDQHTHSQPNQRTGLFPQGCRGMAFWPRYIPKPCSALSSKRLFAQAGPWPLTLCWWCTER